MEEDQQEQAQMAVEEEGRLEEEKTLSFFWLPPITNAAGGSPRDLGARAAQPGPLLKDDWGAEQEVPEGGLRQFRRSPAVC